MKKVLQCCLCPNGCELTVEYEGRTLLSVENHLCKRGAEFARSEIVSPMRTLTTSVKVVGGDYPLASVRSDKPVKRDEIKPIVRRIRERECLAPIHIGQVLVENVDGNGANLIVTRTVQESERL